MSSAATMPSTTSLPVDSIAPPADLYSCSSTREKAMRDFGVKPQQYHKKVPPTSSAITTNQGPSRREESLETMILVTEVLSKKDTVIPLSSIDADYILLYFAASWVPPCIMFTPALRAFYMQHKHTKRFEIIYVPIDKDDASFEKFYASEMPWLAMKMGKAPQVLGGKLGVTNLPTIIILDRKTGRILTREGMKGVVSDPQAHGFPWIPLR